jgi:ADP-ribose pyrophosphatase
LKIKKLKKVTDFKFLNLFELDYQDMKGNQKTWQFATRSQNPKCVSREFAAPDAVVIVPFHTKKQQLVIIKEFRVPLADYQYGFPAGLVDAGKSIAEAGKRELKEETGLNLTRILMESPPVFSTSGMTDESVSMLFVECDGEPDTRLNESSEDITVYFLSAPDAAQLINDRSLKFDVKTWLVLSTFARTGRI